MKKTFLVISIIFIVFLVSYKQNNKEAFYEYNFVPIDSFSLPLFDSVHNLPYDLQLIKTDTANLLFAYFKNSKITVYNLDKQTIIKKIPLKKHKPIFAFRVITLDSIFVFYNTGDFYRYNDTVFNLINYNGEILKNYGIFEEHFKTLKNDTEDLSFQYYTSTLFHKFIYIDYKLFFLVKKLSAKKLGDSASYVRDLPPVGNIDTKTGKLSFINFPIYYPPKGYVYSRYYLSNKIFLTANKNLLFVSPQTADIYEYNFTDKSYKKHRLASVMQDTVTPERIEDNRNYFYFMDNKGSFSDIFYDKYQDLYYRFIYLPKNEYENRKVFVVSDNKLNKLGEGVLSTDYASFKMIATEDYILMLNAKKTVSTEGKMFFTKFKLVKKQTTKKEFAKKFVKLDPDTAKCNFVDSKVGENKNFLNFLDNYIHKDSYAVLFVPFLKSCPPCKDFAVRLYSLNKEYFSNRNVYLFFDYGNVSALKSYLINFNLRINADYIFLDTLQKYDRYVETGLYNP
ncbi:MAG: DUF4221 family protein, partial [Bacteroidota bacterium]|nr:DUF4221 family protein [Bacteroidota bacterium]